MASLGLFRDVRDEIGTARDRCRRSLRNSTGRFVSRRMERLNQTSSEPLLGSQNAPVVSLTSHGCRVGGVHQVIESIGSGDVKPSRLILWLNDGDTVRNPPATLQRQVSRGLELREAPNYGPHTKYYPSVLLGLDGCLVTADDDIVYPTWWLDVLMRTANQTPENVICHRAHRVKTVGSAVAPYASWGSVLDCEASPSVFATGVSGVLYPPAMLEALRQMGDQFLEACPKADDIWLHYVAVTSSVAARQAGKFPNHFWFTPGSQSQTLMSENLLGGNDRFFRSLYNEAVVRKAFGDGA